MLDLPVNTFWPKENMQNLEKISMYCGFGIGAAFGGLSLAERFLNNSRSSFFKDLLAFNGTNFCTLCLIVYVFSNQYLKRHYPEGGLALSRGPFSYDRVVNVAVGTGCLTLFSIVSVVFSVLESSGETQFLSTLILSNVTTALLTTFICSYIYLSKHPLSYQ